MSGPAPHPLPDERSAPFFTGARENKLMLQRCRACGVWLHPVRRRCPECAGTEIGWEQASGDGTVYSHGQLRRAVHPAHEPLLPITLAVVDLDEGVRMSTRLVDVVPEQLRAGLRVRVHFEPLDEELSLPLFQPAVSEPGES